MAKPSQCLPRAIARWYPGAQLSAFSKFYEKGNSPWKEVGHTVRLLHEPADCKKIRQARRRKPPSFEFFIGLRPGKSKTPVTHIITGSDPQSPPLPSKGRFPTGHGWCKASPMENLEGSGAVKAHRKACCTARLPLDDIRGRDCRSEPAKCASPPRLNNKQKTVARYALIFVLQTRRDCGSDE